MSIEKIIAKFETLAAHYNALARSDSGRRLSDRMMANDIAKDFLAAISLLKTHPEAQPNEPLTLEELQKMDGLPVWLECKFEKGWGLISLCSEGMVVVQTRNGSYWVYTYREYNEKLGAELYRRPPKEECA